MEAESPPKYGRIPRLKGWLPLNNEEASPVGVQRDRSHGTVTDGRISLRRMGKEPSRLYYNRDRIPLYRIYGDHPLSADYRTTKTRKRHVQ